MATVNVEAPGAPTRSAASVPFSAVLFPSAARATADAYTSVPFSPMGATAITVYMNVSAVTATPSLVLTVQYYNPATDTWITVATNAAVATAVATSLRLDRNGTTADCIVRTPLFEKMRVVVTHGDADSATYSVSIHYHL